MAHLPLELIFHIISSLIGDPRAILQPSDPATKTLLSFTLVCRATYPVASNHLREHCAYIDNDLRLRQLIYCLESTGGHHHHGGDDTHDAATPPAPAPAPRLLRPLTTLYLAPFARYPIEKQPTRAMWARDLLLLAGPALRRLVVDMPLRSRDPIDDDRLGARAVLREAFCGLTGLEEFVSVRDELDLDREPGGPEPAVWGAWPGLRRLALYNVAADAAFWRAVGRLGALETLVIARPDLLDVFCIKSEYLGTWSDCGRGKTDLYAEGEHEVGPPRPLKVIVGDDFDVETPDDWAGRHKWDRVDPDNIMKVMAYNVGRGHHSHIYQECVKMAALMGDIWDWEGCLVTGTPGSGERTGAGLFELEA